VITCWQESSEDTELRAALAASITDTHFKSVSHDLSFSDSNDTDISDIPDDEELAECSTGSCAVVLGTERHKKSSAETSSTSDSQKLRIEATSRENSTDSDNCVGFSRKAVEVESQIAHNNLPVSTVEEKASSWKDFLGPESGN